MPIEIDFARKLPLRVRLALTVKNVGSCFALESWGAHRKMLAADIPSCETVVSTHGQLLGVSDKLAVPKVMFAAHESFSANQMPSPTSSSATREPLLMLAVSLPFDIL